MTKDKYPKIFKGSLVYNPLELTIKRQGRPVYTLKSDEAIDINGDQILAPNDSIIVRDGIIKVILKVDRQNL